MIYDMLCDMKNDINIYIYMLFTYFLSSNFSSHSGWNWIIIVSVFSFLFFLYSLVSLLTCFPTHLFPYPLVSLPTCFPTHLFPFSLVSLLTCFPTHLFPYSLISLPTCFPTHLFPFSLVSLLTCFPTHLLRQQMWIAIPRPFLTLPLSLTLKNPHAPFSLFLSL